MAAIYSVCDELAGRKERIFNREKEEKRRMDLRLVPLPPTHLLVIEFSPSLIYGELRECSHG